MAATFMEGKKWQEKFQLSPKKTPLKGSVGKRK